MEPQNIRDREAIVKSDYQRQLEEIVIRMRVRNMPESVIMGIVIDAFNKAKS